MGRAGGSDRDCTNGAARPGPSWSQRDHSAPVKLSWLSESPSQSLLCRLTGQHKSECAPNSRADERGCSGVEGFPCPCPRHIHKICHFFSSNLAVLYRAICLVSPRPDSICSYKIFQIQAARRGLLFVRGQYLAPQGSRSLKSLMSP